MGWIIDQILGNMGRTKLFNLICRAARRIFGKLYRDMLSEVQAAELIQPPLSGVDKAKVVIAAYKESHDEAAEWSWLVNILLEIAVGEFKSYGERV